MSSFRAVLLCLVAAGLFVTGYASSRSIKTGLALALLPSKTQFSVKLIVRSFAGEIEDDSTIAVRADGSLAHSVSRTIRIPRFSSKPETTTFRTVLDVATKRQTTVYPAFNGKTSIPLPDSAIVTLKTVADKECTADAGRIMGFEQFLGLKVIRIQKYGGGDGNEEKFVLDEWRALDLDCFALKSVLQTTDTHGKVTTRRTATATSVKFGSPDPSQFSVPPDYRELTPSMALDLDAQHRGIPPSSCARTSALRADSNYFERRADSR